MKAQDLFEQITNELVAAIEAGAADWKMPWHTLAEAGTPVSVEGRPYRGINSLWLPMVAAAKGWDSGIWGTYKAWKAKGCQVRKGEKSTQVILWKPTKRKDKETGVEKDSLFATTYNVFAAEQVDGSEDLIAARKAVPHDAPEQIADAEAYFTAVGAKLIVGGNSAYYMPVNDEIHVPAIEQFESAPHFYTTLAHEHVHWTGHESRLDRELKTRFGSDSYAAEELVAELGAAMWSAQAGLSSETRDDHASYLAGWLRILKADPKALVTVSSKAQKAVDFLNKSAAGEEVDHEVRVEAMAR